MSQGYLGYQPGSERMWWWKVAQHLDEAKGALANALAHNLDDQSRVFALEEKLREAQVILLAIFEAKGLVPSSGQGVPSATMPGSLPFQPQVFWQEPLQEAVSGGMPESSPQVMPESSFEGTPGVMPESPQESVPIVLQEQGRELESAVAEPEPGVLPDVLVPEVGMPPVIFPEIARG